MISEIGVQCFLTAVENKSFTKTAEVLYMSRQAVSKQIAQLEKELDTKLFIRTTAKVEVTPAGALFATYFRNTLKEWEKVRYLAKATELKQQNTVRIGTPFDMEVGEKIFQAVKKCQNEGLELQLQWECAEAGELVQRLMEEKLDVVISFERSMEEIEHAREMLDMQFYTRISANLTVSKRNPRYSKDAVPADFEEEACYVVKEMFSENATVGEFQKDWKKYGLTIRDVRIAPNRDSMKTMVELGAGFTICTDLDSFARKQGIANVPLNRKLELYTIWRKKESSTPVLAFLDELNQLNF